MACYSFLILYAFVIFSLLRPIDNIVYKKCVKMTAVRLLMIGFISIIYLRIFFKIKTNEDTYWI